MSVYELLTKHDAIASPLLIAPVIVALILLERRYRSRRQREQAVRAAQSLSPMPEERRLPWKRGLLSGASLAALYLLVFRLLSFLPPVYQHQKGGALLMSLSFLFLGPFLAGVLTVAQGTRKEPWPVRAWLLAPWIPILFNILLALAIRWEGIICAVFIVPPALVSASLGGALAGSLQRRLHSRVSRTLIPCFAVLPLVFALAETALQQPLQTRQVNTAILIHAAPSVVWLNIERVRPIQPPELRFSWANTIGFPRPVEATLSHEGVGGVRDASFERGLAFTETVTDWQPLQRLAFTIQANTSAIPSTTLDEHVTVGGRFFDVLAGEYALEPLADGSTLLHLSSRERLSTDFNAYAALWSDAVMRDMQSNILHVIQQRCEREQQQATAAASR